jgi:hypothetical protein
MPNKTARKSKTEERLTIGREASLHISRVEGLHMTDEMRRTFATMDMNGLSPAARRQLLIGKYGKNSG